MINPNWNGTTFFEQNAEEILKRKAITKVQLAKAMDISPQNVKKLFATKNIFTLMKIGDFLGLSLDYLTMGPEPTIDIHGCIYINGEEHLVKSRKDIEDLLMKLEDIATQLETKDNDAESGNQ